MSGKKKFSFMSVILSVICVVFVCEAAAPAAAIGNQQFFWWIFLIITFLLPYGMVVAELGTTYDSEGGIYDWVRDALGDKWGARISWYYWINFPLWIASLATLFPPILGMVFGADIESNLALTLARDRLRVDRRADGFEGVSSVDSERRCVLKVLVAVSVGVLGIWFAVQNGSRAAATFLPTSPTPPRSIPVHLIFNSGLRWSAPSPRIQKPARDIPKAIILGAGHRAITCSAAASALPFRLTRRPDWMSWP
ncbi:MAG: amino acid permease [Adlercreutzia sp.]